MLSQKSKNSCHLCNVMWADSQQVDYNEYTPTWIYCCPPPSKVIQQEILPNHWCKIHIDFFRLCWKKAKLATLPAFTGALVCMQCESIRSKWQNGGSDIIKHSLVWGISGYCGKMVASSHLCTLSILYTYRYLCTIGINTEGWLIYNYHPTRRR